MAPGTHKLGVLYVVDSVTRQWVEAARKAGQPPGSAAPDGTFAAGVNRVTELLPVLMTDIINNAPQDQKVRTRICSAQSGREPCSWGPITSGELISYPPPCHSSLLSLFENQYCSRMSAWGIRKRLEN